LAAYYEPAECKLQYYGLYSSTFIQNGILLLTEGLTSEEEMDKWKKQARYLDSVYVIRHVTSRWLTTAQTCYNSVYI